MNFCVQIGLTLPILAVLVAGSSHSWVNAVARGAVGGGAVRLWWGEAVHRLDSGLSWTLATTGGDAVGRRIYSTLEWRHGEVMMLLRRDTAGVTEEVHHLQTQRTNCFRVPPETLDHLVYRNMLLQTTMLLLFFFFSLLLILQLLLIIIIIFNTDIKHEHNINVSAPEQLVDGLQNQN